MPKRKTRAQKQKADARNLASVVTSTSSENTFGSSIPVYSFSTNKKIISHTTTQHTGNTITLVKKDLVKTAIVSISIVLLQVIFYFLLYHHVLAINFVRY